MRIIRFLKKVYLSGNDAYGTRINQLQLLARDKLFLDKIFPQTKQAQDIGEQFWKGTLHIYRVLFAYGLVFTFSKIIAHIRDFSVEKTLLFCGLLSIILSTGPSVLLSKERIEKLDDAMFSIVFTIKSFILYSLKNNLCLSNKSSHEIQYKYIVYPYMFIVMTGVFSLQMANFFLSESSNIYMLLDSIMLYPLRFIENNYDWLQYTGISVLLFFGLTYAPTFNVEKTFFERKEYFKWTKRIIFYNLFISVSHVLATIAPQIYFIENNLYGMKYEILFSKGFVVSLAPIVFIYIQTWLAIYLHQKITMEYMNKEKASMLYFLLITILLPYFIFLYIFIQLIPSIIIFLFSKLLLYYFDITKFVFKVPSVVRLSGFLIALSIAIYKFFVV